MKSLVQRPARLVYVALFCLSSRTALAGQNAWTTGGPASKTVSSVAAGPSYLLAATAQGIYRSTDGGATWTLTTPSTVSISSVSVGATGTAFAGSSDGSFFRSSDGISWVQIIPPNSAAIFRVRADPKRPARVYRDAVTPQPPEAGLGALLRSDDDGATWVHADGGLNSAAIRAMAFDPGNSDVLYGATRNFHTSVDAGANWTQIGSGLPTVVNAVAVDPFGPSTIYLGGFDGVFKSANGGASFVPVNSGLPQQPSVKAIVLDPARPGWAYISTFGAGVFLSTNSGMSWNSVNDGLTNLLVPSLALDPGSARLHAGTSGGGVFDRDILLVLNAAHPFTVTLSARDQRTGHVGSGLPFPQNDIFGYFSLPDLTGNSANPEVFVKILDGTGVNGKYWVFYGGLTDLEYTLTVTEDSTGKTKTYTKPAGSASGGFDTSAFP